MLPQWRQRLCEDGWTAATERFWEAVPCFYDLGMVRTVLLVVSEQDGAGRGYAEVYYWKHGDHGRPEYLAQAHIEVRRYKLHHSMNALLWHDHGNRPLWPA